MALRIMCVMGSRKSSTAVVSISTSSPTVLRRAFLPWIAAVSRTVRAYCRNIGPIGTIRARMISSCSSAWSWSIWRSTSMRASISPTLNICRTRPRAMEISPARSSMRFSFSAPTRMCFTTDGTATSCSSPSSRRRKVSTPLSSEAMTEASTTSRCSSRSS